MAPYGATVAKIFTVCMGSIQKTRVAHTIPKECHRCKKKKCDMPIFWKEDLLAKDPALPL
jgi:hypothetical protein